MPGFLDDVDPIGPPLETVLLDLLREQLKIRVGPNFAERMTIKLEREQFVMGVVATVSSSILAHRLGRETRTGSTIVEFKRAANWREAWKAEHAGTWYGQLVLRWFPARAPIVDKIQVDLSVDLKPHLAFPQSTLRYPTELGRPVHVMLQEPDAWTRTPLTQLFRRPTRDGA